MALPREPHQSNQVLLVQTRPRRPLDTGGLIRLLVNIARLRNPAPLIFKVLALRSYESKPEIYVVKDRISVFLFIKCLGLCVDLVCEKHE